MAIERNITKIRSIKEGFGINGVQLNLSMSHIYSLMDLRSQNEYMLGLSQTPEQTEVINQTIKVLSFIIGDIQNPMDSKLWEEQ